VPLEETRSPEVIILLDSTRYFYLNQAGKTISNVQFYGMDCQKMMQNGGNYAIVKSDPPQPSSLWGENVGKIYSSWILVNKKVSLISS
jgi:hypothetical protein